MSESGGSSGPEDWSDWEESEEGPVKSLFSDTWLPTVEEIISHDKNEHGFDLNVFRLKERLDMYSTIQLINYLRSHVDESPASLLATLQGRPWVREEYYQPVLANDALLTHDWEDEDGEDVGESGAAGPGLNSSPRSAPKQLADQAALQAAVAALQAALLDDAPAEGSSGSSPSAVESAQSAQVDAAYFESYSFFDIHREMLSDKARTEAYRTALEGNPELVSGARVLDVGCGTGILSMFAARGGASSVVGVDGSAHIAEVALRNVETNDLSSQIRIVTGRVEAVETLPVPGGKVDILVSEWMGYALLFESMLDSVLSARDKFLKPGGAMLPDQATIYVAGGGLGSSGLVFWNDVYGFNMAPVQQSLQAAAEREALVRRVKPEDLVTSKATLQSFDLASMVPADQDFTATFQLQALQGQGDATAPCTSIVLWFDTGFSSRFCKQTPVTLDTSPSAPATHWAQTVLVLREPISLANGSGVCGLLSFNRNKAKHRSLDITLQVAPFTPGEQSVEEVLAQAQVQTQLFTMGVGAHKN